MKPFAVAASTFCLSALFLLHAYAESAEPGIQGRAIGNTIFDSLDQTDRGSVHMREIEQFRESVFLGMDAYDDRRVTYGEFSSWDPVFSRVAAD